MNVLVYFVVVSPQIKLVSMKIKTDLKEKLKYAIESKQTKRKRNNFFSLDRIIKSRKNKRNGKN